MDEKQKQERIKKIDSEIKTLEERVKRFEGKNKGIADKAREDITKLKLEKQDLENGTNELRSYQIHKEIERLKKARNNVGFMKASYYDTLILKQEDELRALGTR